MLALEKNLNVLITRNGNASTKNEKTSEISKHTTGCGMLAISCVCYLYTSQHFTM